MAALNEAQFEKKLLNLKDTQESISGLSSWCLQQPHNHKKIVQIWLQILKKVKIEQRLTLFYLANDVIQYSKRKGYDFVESWGTALQRATTMVRGDDRVRNKVLRLFTIWDERNIYDESFLVDLVGLLSSRTPAQTSVPDAQDFQPSTLIAKIRSCKQLEDETDLRLKIVNESHLQLSDADALRCSLKDRRHGEDVIAEVEEGIGRMQKYIDSLSNEVKDRAELIEQLDLADVFYETQRGEARIVCNAYSNFGKRVKTLKRKLDDLKPNLPSPLPSPDVNAPSPSPESDIQLPDEVNDVPAMGMTSFIGSMVIPDNIPEPYVPPQLAAQIVQHIALEEVPVQGVPAPKQSHYPVPPPPTHYQPHPHPHAHAHSHPHSHPPPPVPTTPSPHPPPPHHMNSHVPHHINNSMDFPMNGSTSFMNRGPRDSPVPPFLDSTSSFIGNANFSFDFMKDESVIENTLETPASPSPRSQLPDDGVDEFSAPTPKEGNPIEVISSNPNDSTGFSLSEFLKNLIPSQNNSQSLDTTQLSSINSSMVDPSLMIDTSAGTLPLNDTFPSALPILTDPFPPVVPPPPPPIEEPFPEKLWNSSNLPPKFPSWNDSQTSWGEARQSSYKEPFLFDVPPPSLAPSEDRDMRVMPKNKMNDIDHRNLISLTGSPRHDNNRSWKNTTPRKTDVDLRRRAASDSKDIVESIDMDLSDDDDNHCQAPMSSTPKNPMHAMNKPMKQPFKTPVHQVPNHRSTPRNSHTDQPSTRNISNNTLLGPSISFNIATSNKIVKESPLKETEEQPKKKLPLLHDVHLTPPAKSQVSPAAADTAELVFPDIAFPPVVLSPQLIQNVLPDLTAPPPPPPPPPPLLDLPVVEIPSTEPLKPSPPEVTNTINKQESTSDKKASNNLSGGTTTKRKDSLPALDKAESLLKTPELFLEEVLNADLGDAAEPNDVDAAAMLYEDLYDESMDNDETSHAVEEGGEDLLRRAPPPPDMKVHVPPPPHSPHGFRPPPPGRGGQMWRPPRRGMFPRGGMRPPPPPPPHFMHHGPGAANSYSPRQMGPRPPFQWRQRFPKW